jgi:hypothetical protein
MATALQDVDWHRLVETTPKKETFRCPSAWFSESAPSEIFGRKSQKAERREAHVVVTCVNGAAQLSLLSPNAISRVVAAKDTAGAGVEVLAEVLGARIHNRVNRVFWALVALAEMQGTLEEGRFVYSASRIARVLGVRRTPMGVAREAGYRYRDLRAIDRDVELLSNISLSWRATVAGVRDQLIEIPKLIFEHARVNAACPGRRNERLMQFNLAFVSLFLPGRANYFPVPISALAPPLVPTSQRRPSRKRTKERVDPRTWDDAFKVLQVLSHHARRNANAARGPEARPWKISVKWILARANITESSTRRKVFPRALRLFAALENAWTGPLPGEGVQLLSGEVGEDGFLTYDLPHIRRQLRSIHPRQPELQLPAVAAPELPPPVAGMETVDPVAALRDIHAALGLSGGLTPEEIVREARERSEGRND